MFLSQLRKCSVSPNASEVLDTALRTGNSSYNPQSAVVLFFASARNQITVNSHVVPSVLGTVSPILATAGSNHTAAFMQSLQGNQSLLAPALRCPQCLASPFVLASIDLIPFDSAAATGSTMVGLIFVGHFFFLPSVFRS